MKSDPNRLKITSSKIAKQILAGRQGYKVQIDHQGKLKDVLFTGDQYDCESFIRTFSLKEKNNLLKQNKSFAIVSPDGRVIPSLIS